VSIKPHDPAFPAIATVDKNDIVQPLQTSPSGFSFPGLTVRAHFAAMFLQGLCANADYTEASNAEMAMEAVGLSDSLITALNK
jgi:hypothetical protein